MLGVVAHRVLHCLRCAGMQKMDLEGRQQRSGPENADSISSGSAESESSDESDSDGNSQGQSPISVCLKLETSQAKEFSLSYETCMYWTRQWKSWGQWHYC